MSESYNVKEAFGAVAQGVLVVDDDASMRMALETNFLRRGWKVLSASGTTEAVTRFQQARPALVVTDIRMIDGDGFDVLKKVRACDPEAAVILLTAYGSIPGAVEAIKDGACDYIRKPFTPDQVKQHVTPLLGNL